MPLQKTWKKVAKLCGRLVLDRWRWLALLLLGLLSLLFLRSNARSWAESMIELFNAKRSSILLAYDRDPIRTTLVYLVIYIVATALTVPIAVPLSMAAGIIFGFWRGTLLVSLASTIGATLSFLAARHLFRRWVARRFPMQLASVNRQLEKDGVYYLFTVRLIPVFPFFLMNILLGLTSMRTASYFWVSLIGMLAGTMLYVNAGVAMGRIEDLGDLLTVDLIASFIAIGLVPLLVKKLVDRLRAPSVKDRPSGIER